MLRGLLQSLMRVGVREKKMRCSICQHFCDVHRIRVGPPPEGLDMGDAFICAKCGRLFCSACGTQYALAMLNDACPECGGRVTQVPIWRERTASGSGGRADPDTVGPTLKNRVLALFVFKDTLDSPNLGQRADAVLGILERDRGAPTRERPARGEVMQGCMGYLALPPQGKTPAVEVLADWLVSGAYGIDSQHLDPDVAIALRSRHRLGYAPCIIGIGPIPKPYVITAHDELKQKVGGYLGLLTFSQAKSLVDIAHKLYIRTMLQMEL